MHAGVFEEVGHPFYLSSENRSFRNPWDPEAGDPFHYNTDRCSRVVNHVVQLLSQDLVLCLTGAGPSTHVSSTVPTRLRVPETEAKLVFLPHLIRLLDEGLRCKLTLVSAPAGYGKTTSVATWMRSLGDQSSASPHPEPRSGVRTAWYSLDPEDNDLSTFFTRFTAAIQVASPGALQMVATGLDLEAMPADQYANALAEACLKLPQPVVLVLDDYRLIAESGIHTVLFHLIQYASAKLHLVRVTRQDPPLTERTQKPGRSPALRDSVSAVAGQC